MKNQLIRQEFAKYVSLNTVGMLALSCYILADTFFVARGLGTDGLTALNLAIPIYSFLHGTGLMLGMGGAIQYAIHKHRDDQHQANLVFTHSIFLAGIFSVLYVAIGALFVPQIVQWVGADAATYAMSKTYIEMILWFSPAFLFNNVLLCFIRNDGAPHLSMVAMITGSLSNVVLDYIFIFPLQMGMFGAVFATCLSPMISLAILSSHLIRKKNQFALVKSKIVWGFIRPIFSGGMPSLVTEFSSGIVIMILNMMILRLEGNIGVAAYGVVANLSLVMMAVYTGVAQGIQPLISKYYGRKEDVNVQKIFHYAVITITALSIFIYVILFFASTPIVSVFNKEGNPILQAIAETGIKIYFTASLFAGWNIVLSAYFTAKNAPRPAHTLSMLRGFILIIPIAFLLSAQLGMVGVWGAFPLTELITALCGLQFYRLVHKAGADA